MGQKVNPIGLRLSLNKKWQSRWFANKKDFEKEESDPCRGASMGVIPNSLVDEITSSHWFALPLTLKDYTTNASKLKKI